MILRDATPEDATTIAQLGADAFCAAFAHLYNQQDLGGFLAASHSPARTAAEIVDPGMRIRLAIDDDGKLIGFCKLVLACGWPEHARAERVIELKQLYTDPAVTGRGIGAALMDWVLDEARVQNAGEIQLSVYSDNHGAQRFYARYGFEKVADIHFMVGEQRDEEFLFSRVL
ncbi:ribosomal protein S18 acetylase RimI-like enzyme [Novosphingobium chloroacetimidivorans]|uniref:Ribosomal protein S18 acetylase RimI-like enzyme n=1 Tax=Novosphingobium chloroacetimidivorans TaxID=1428314 RepID=A0A7W7K832_9SPHN|nr:GNAT family N-acetyltransferase [Novosphingobium chloroacetimidivorans]MBB4857626.1 ribosomal protein S18 acetylase RimI-like enzyme [Novosphingobium chloroacetimidivorans]